MITSKFAPPLATLFGLLMLCALGSGCMVIHQVAPDGDSVLVLGSKGWRQSVFSCGPARGDELECQRIFGARALNRALDDNYIPADEDDLDDGLDYTVDADDALELNERLEEARTLRSREQELARESSGKAGEAGRSELIAELQAKLDAAGVTDSGVRLNLLNQALVARGFAPLDGSE